MTDEDKLALDSDLRVARRALADAEIHHLKGDYRSLWHASDRGKAAVDRLYRRVDAVHRARGPSDPVGEAFVRAMLAPGLGGHDVIYDEVVRLYESADWSGMGRLKNLCVGSGTRGWVRTMAMALKPVREAVPGVYEALCESLRDRSRTDGSDDTPPCVDSPAMETKPTVTRAGAEPLARALREMAGDPSVEALRREVTRVYWKHVTGSDPSGVLSELIPMEGPVGLVFWPDLPKYPGNVTGPDSPWNWGDGTAAPVRLERLSRVLWMVPKDGWEFRYWENGAVSLHRTGCDVVPPPGNYRPGHWKRGDPTVDVRVGDSGSVRAPAFVAVGLANTGMSEMQIRPGLGHEFRVARLHGKDCLCTIRVFE